MYGELCHDAKRLSIAFKPGFDLTLRHIEQTAQCLLPYVSKWRVPEIVGQRGGFDHVRIDLAQKILPSILVLRSDKALGKPTRNLR